MVHLSSQTHPLFFIWREVFPEIKISQQLTDDILEKIQNFVRSFAETLEAKHSVSLSKNIKHYLYDDFKFNQNDFFDCLTNIYGELKFVNTSNDFKKIGYID